MAQEILDKIKTEYFTFLDVEFFEQSYLTQLAIIKTDRNLNIISEINYYSVDQCSKNFKEKIKTNPTLCIKEGRRTSFILSEFLNSMENSTMFLWDGSNDKKVLIQELNRHGYYYDKRIFEDTVNVQKLIAQSYPDIGVTTLKNAFTQLLGRNFCNFNPHNAFDDTKVTFNLFKYILFDNYSELNSSELHLDDNNVLVAYKKELKELDDLIKDYSNINPLLKNCDLEKFENDLKNVDDKILVVKKIEEMKDSIVITILESRYEEFGKDVEKLLTKPSKNSYQKIYDKYNLDYFTQYIKKFPQSNFSRKYSTFKRLN